MILISERLMACVSDNGASIYKYRSRASKLTRDIHVHALNEFY